MRLTVGPLPPAVYWRRRAIVAAGFALVIVAVAMTCSSLDLLMPITQRGDQPVPDHSTSPTNPVVTPEVSDAGTAGPTAPGSFTASTGYPAGSSTKSADGVKAVPPVVASVPCTDAEIALTTAVSPSPGRYGGVIRLTLIVRNTANHACLRDVGSAQEELQVRQGETVLWSSDHCGPAQTSDVRAFGPNIESRFWRTWNTYRVAPYECDPPPDATPAGAGQYQVVARLGTKVSEPMSFEIRT